MTYTSRPTAFALGFALLTCVLLSACDTQVYADEELKAQERFGSIKVGATEHDVRASLGTPSGVAEQRGQDHLSFESGEVGNTLLDAKDRSKWPADLQYMPKRLVSGKVLVYTDATVTAYYFVGLDGRVEYVEVFTS